MSYGICNREAATPFPIGVLVPVEKRHDLVSEDILENCVCWINVNAGNVTGTIGIGRPGEKQGGTQEIGYLKAGMILAMAESGHLQNAPPRIAADLEFLGED
jgi:hypothetical protein